MSQSRFSIVLVGVSALLRRPLVSRLRPADGERSSWVVFTARVGRFESGFRSAVGLRAHCFRFSACAASELPLGEFVLPPSVSEITAGRVRSSAFRFGNCPPRVGLRAHCFRFSACTDSEIAARRVGASTRRVGLRAHGFRFSACTASGLPLGGLAFGLTASAFRHAPLRKLPSAGSFFRWAGWPSGSLLPLFGTPRFGDCPRRIGLRASASEIPLGGLAFGLTASAFRHAPLGGCRSAGWPSGSRLPLFGTHRFGVALGELVLLPPVSAFAARRVGSSAFRFGVCCSAGWPSGSRLLLFGMRRSAPPRRRREDRRSTTTRQLFHFKTLIPTC